MRTKLENEDMVLKNWLLSDQNFEKLGELMAKNDGKVLGLCDELTNLLSQVNLYSGATGLLDTHEFTKVLELFSGTAWSRQTGNTTFIYHPKIFKLLYFYHCLGFHFIITIIFLRNLKAHFQATMLNRSPYLQCPTLIICFTKQYLYDELYPICFLS